MLWTSLPPSPCLWCNTVPLHCLPSLIHRCSVVSCTVPTLLIDPFTPPVVVVVVVSFSLNETNKNEHVPSHFLLFLFHSSHLWSEPPDLHFPLHRLCSRLPTFFQNTHKSLLLSNTENREAIWHEGREEQSGADGSRWVWLQRQSRCGGAGSGRQTNRTQAHKQNCHLAAHPQI